MGFFPTNKLPVAGGTAENVMAGCPRKKIQIKKYQDYLLDNLNEDVIGEIVSPLNLKSRTQLKTLSKNWLSLINRHKIPLKTKNGLLVVNNNPILGSSTLLGLRENNIPVISSSIHSFPYLIDGCNGLILYGKYENNVWSYHLGTTNLECPVDLPNPPKVPRIASVNLVYDGVEEYKILCLMFDQIDSINNTVQCLVFHSKTWEWLEYNAKFFNTHLLEANCFSKVKSFKRNLYFRNKVYVACVDSLLVYYVHADSLKAIPLPRTTMYTMMTEFGVLYESQGRVQFCAPSCKGELVIWDFYDNGYHGNDDKWSLSKFINLERELCLRKLDPFNNFKVSSGGWFSRKKIQPIFFDEYLQRIYLLLKPGVIASYSYESKKLEIEWCFDGPEYAHSKSSIFPVLINPKVSLLI